MSEDGNRSKRLQRLLKVQGQKRLLEEWRLSHLADERRKVERDDVELLESLGPTSSLHGYFVEAKVRTLRRNDMERRRIEREREAAAERLAEARRAETGIEKLRDGAERSETAREGAEALQSSIEAFLNGRRSSLE